MRPLAIHGFDFIARMLDADIHRLDHIVRQVVEILV